MTLVTQAAIFAANAHDGATRKGSRIPYIVHPMEAAAIAATLTDDPQVVAAAMLLRQPLILVLIAFWMLMSSLSVIIQVTYFKKTGGKRIFKMSPIHHHFELCGMSEFQIVAMYMTTTLALCLIALMGVL